MPLKREDAAEFARRARAKGISDNEIRVHLQNLGGVEPSAEASASARRGILKAIDYPGSVLRAGVYAPMIEAASGKNLGTSFGKAVRGEESTPGTAELLERGGVPELGRASDVIPGFAEPGQGGYFQPEKGGALDITGRGLIGFGGDIAGDPLTYGTAGLKTGAKALERAGRSRLGAAARVAAEPIGSAIRGLGKGMYKTGIMPAEMHAKKFGKESLTPTLMGEGIYSAPWKGTISEQMDTLGEGYLADLEARAARSAETGVPARMSDAVQPMLAKAKELRAIGDAPLIKEAQALEARAAELMNLDPKYAQTPVERIPSRVSTIDLPTQGQGVTPIEPRPAKVSEAGLPETSLDFAGQPRAGAPGIGVLREPPGMQRAGPSTLTQESTGPFQFIEPGGYVKGGPTTEETAGLLAPQVRFLKTRANENVRKNAWNPNAVNDLDAQISKLEGQGLREEELATIERSLGPEERAAQEATNQKLGSILTTKEQQAMHEARMAKKLPLGQIKAAALVHDPLAGLGMIGAQLLEKSMTPIGYGVYKAGQKVPEPVLRQGLMRSTDEPKRPVPLSAVEQPSQDKVASLIDNDAITERQNRDLAPLREGILAGLNKLDSVTGAPARQAISQILGTKSTDPAGPPIRKVIDQFGADPATAPTWPQLAGQAGIENETIQKAVGLLGPFLEPNVPIGSVAAMAKRVGKGGRVIDFAKELEAAGGPKPVDRVAQLHGDTGKIIGMSEDTLPNAARDYFEKEQQKVWKDKQTMHPSSAEDWDQYDKLKAREGKIADRLEKADAISEGRKKPRLRAADPTVDKPAAPTSMRESFLARFGDDLEVEAAVQRIEKIGKHPYATMSESGISNQSIPVPKFNFEAGNEIGHRGIMHQTNVRTDIHDPLPWMDSKYEITKSALKNAKSPVRVNTSSDLIARDDYIEALPLGSTVRIYGLSPAENLNRLLFPGNPSQKRLEAAVEKLKSAGVDVKMVMPTIDEYLDRAMAIDIRNPRILSEVTGFSTDKQLRDMLRQSGLRDSRLKITDPN